jgi:hypothetical protein
VPYKDWVVKAWSPLLDFILLASPTGSLAQHLPPPAEPPRTVADSARARKRANQESNSPLPMISFYLGGHEALRIHPVTPTESQLEHRVCK